MNYILPISTSVGERASTDLGINRRQQQEQQFTALLSLGIKWIYQIQPEAEAAIAPSGIVYQGKLPERVREIRICPQGYHCLPMIVVEPAHPSGRQAAEFLKFQLIKDDMLLLGNLITRAGGEIVKIYHSEEFENIYFLLSVPAHETLLKAVENSHEYCPAHKSYHCCDSCRRYQDNFEKIIIPDGWK